MDVDGRVAFSAQTSCHFYPFLHLFALWIVNDLGSSHCKANIAPVHHGIKTSPNHWPPMLILSYSIQFWRCGGVCSIPISKIPQVLRFQAQGMKRFFGLWTHTSRIRLAQRLISAEFGLHVLREPDCAVVPLAIRGTSLNSLGRSVSSACEHAGLSVQPDGRSRKCWKFKPHRPPLQRKKPLHVQNWTKTSGIQQASPTG